MGDVKKFLKQLGLQFSFPKGATENPEEWQKPYIDELSFFSETVLEFTAKKLIANRESRTFPLVSECLKACKETFNEFAQPPKQPKPKEPKGGRVWTAEDASKADKLFASDWGRRAVADGIEIALWDFMVKEGRWPNENEYQQVKEISKARQAEFNEWKAGIEATQGLTAGAQGWLNTMKRKRERLESLANG